VELEDGVLTIQGEKKEEQRDENVQGLLLRAPLGHVHPPVHAASGGGPERDRGDVQNGILTVHVPKAEEAKGRKIQITEGGRDVS
jgi:HSP20 family protein